MSTENTEGVEENESQSIVLARSGNGHAHFDCRWLSHGEKLQHPQTKYQRAAGSCRGYIRRQGFGDRD